MAQQQDDKSGMGVVLGILLAVVLAIGVYFFLRSDADTNTLEPAAGIDVPAGDIGAGDAGDTGAPGGTGTGGGTTPAQ